MTTPLLDVIKKQIARNGPMDTGTYLGLVLGHPKYGYYMRRDPFGTMGDFITAPEVSQMFGEVIGAWAADTWMKLGSPDSFVLIEGGPGRGTLMADMMRATKKIPGFHEAAEIHLLETSTVLRRIQAGALKGYKVKWHDTLATIPADRKVIFISNELLDALPVRQFEKTESGWMERVVILAKDSKPRHAAQGTVELMRAVMPNLYAPRAEEESGLEFTLVPFAGGMAVPPELEDAKAGSIFEFSAARVSLMANVAAMIKAQGGAALWIDYGHIKSKVGDTFRAIYRHNYVHPLTFVGDADLSFHVDFAAMAKVAQEGGVRVHGPVTQGEFLKAIGIGQRAQALKANASEQRAKDIEKALQRLCDSDQMGEVFKVMGLSYGTTEAPSGF